MGATLTAVIHAESGVGKSWLADTVPAPRLILDAEGGSQYTPSRPKVLWNPLTYAPPGTQGCEPGQEEVPATTRVMVREFAVLQRIEQWLDSGNHPFKSVAIDSLTEIQKRCQDKIAGTQQFQQAHWGELLREMEALIRRMRDLTMHPNNPLEAVVVVALTSDKGGRFRPHLQGQIVTTLPGFVDLVGYMYLEQDDTGKARRKLLIQPLGAFVAKDRTDILTEAYGPVLTLRDPHDPQDQNLDIERMLAVINARVNGQ